MDQQYNKKLLIILCIWFIFTKLTISKEKQMRYILLIAVLIFSTGNLFAANTVSMMLGDVKIQSLGSNSWQKVAYGQTVKIGDTIQTGAQSIAEINSSGNIIRIQPSHMHVNEI
jgi:hypothetical protein